MASSFLADGSAASGKPDEGHLRRSEDILAAAVEVFARRGFAAADVQEIADKAGVGKGTVYRHFGTKEGLFLAAADRGARQLRAAIEATRIVSDDPLLRMRAACVAFLTFFDEHSEYLELVIQERAHFRDRQTPTFFDPGDDENCHRWAAELEAMVQQTILRPLPAQQIMDIIGHMLFGAVFVNYFAGGRKPLALQSEQIVDAIFHGIVLSKGSANPHV
jgi:AcrR family transcriptional regulator